MSCTDLLAHRDCKKCISICKKKKSDSLKPLDYTVKLVNVDQETSLACRASEPSWGNFTFHLFIYFAIYKENATLLGYKE